MATDGEVVLVEKEYLLKPPTSHDKVEEVTQFRCTDGSLWETMDLACDHQESVDFKAWCDENICKGGEWSAEMVATEILAHWKLTKKPVPRSES